MRVKTGFKRKRRHVKVLQRTKGMRMSKGRLYKVSQDAVLHAGQYSFHGRKRRKRDFRTLWVQRINAGLLPFGLKYSRFVHLLKETKIKLDRKILAELAVNDPETFSQIVKTVCPK